jgi:hypothetical protein
MMFLCWPNLNNSFTRLLFSSFIVCLGYNWSNGQIVDSRCVSTAREVGVSIVEEDVDHSIS